MKKYLFIMLSLLMLLLTACGMSEQETSALAEPTEVSVSSTVAVQTEEITVSITETIQSEVTQGESTKHREWIDVDGDGEEEYVEVAPDIWEWPLDEVLADPELTAMLFESSHFDIRNYDDATILENPVLLEYVLTNCDYWDYVEMKETPYSTCFSSIGYNKYWESLIVVFRNSGAWYEYDGVSIGTAEELLDSTDPGEYYNDYIKGNYPSERIN